MDARGTGRRLITPAGALVSGKLVSRRMPASDFICLRKRVKLSRQGRERWRAVSDGFFLNLWMSRCGLAARIRRGGGAPPYHNWINDFASSVRARDSNRAYALPDGRAALSRLKRCFKAGFKGIFLPPRRRKMSAGALLSRHPDFEIRFGASAISRNPRVPARDRVA